MFCRHNRLTGRCPICNAEQEDRLDKAPPRASRSQQSAKSASRPSGAASPARAAGSPRRSSTRLVTRQLARAADDGYRNPLAPGLKATADAERLAWALYAATARLVPPGPYPVLATMEDADDALWLAFLLALVGPDAPERQAALAEARPAVSDEGVIATLTPHEQPTAVAYRAWAARSGSARIAFAGDTSWSPERRFGRLFERLALPGFGRAQRFELLIAVGAAGHFALQADGLRIGNDEDATTHAAKRLLVSGDRMLLERRVRELASACAVPIAALDRGLALWGAPGTPSDADVEIPASTRRALRLS